MLPPYVFLSAWLNFKENLYRLSDSLGLMEWTTEGKGEEQLIVTSMFLSGLSLHGIQVMKGFET